MSFLNELKRRNVLRIAIFYLAGSWLLIQVLETLFPIFRLDETSIQIVVIILAIGFIPALILSWVFELTPEGVKRDKDVDRSVLLQAGRPEEALAAFEQERVGDTRI